MSDQTKVIYQHDYSSDELAKIMQTSCLFHTFLETEIGLNTVCMCRNKDFTVLFSWDRTRKHGAGEIQISYSSLLTHWAWRPLSIEHCKRYVLPLKVLPAIPSRITSEVFSSVTMELERAIDKFPEWPTDPLHAIAIVSEEFGELTQAVLRHVYEPYKSSLEDIKTEAIQAIAMLIRFLGSTETYEFQKSGYHYQNDEKLN